MKKGDPKKDSHSVFLSYAWQNKATANRIYFDLIRSGIKVWKDDQTSEKAWKLWEKISGVINQCQYFLLLDSIDARITSQWVHRECEHAFKLESTGQLQIVVALVDNHEDTHRKDELFIEQNERLYFDFSNLKEYDFDGKYQQSISELCAFFDTSYIPWTDIPTDQDFEQELSQIKHLDTSNRTILIKDYEVFQHRYRNNFATSESRLHNLMTDCKVLQVDSISLYLALGKTQMRTEAFTQAVSTFTMTQTLFQDDPRACMGLGTSHFFLGNYQKAIEAFLKTELLIKRNRNPKHLNHLQDVYRNLLMVYVAAQDFERANTTYSKLDLNQQELPEVQKAYGEILIAQGNKRAAIAIYKSLFQHRNQGNAEAFLELAHCLKCFEEFAEATSILEEGMTECAEDNFEIKKELSYQYYNHIEYSKAATILESLIDYSEKTNFQIYVELATIYFIMLKENYVRSYRRKRQLLAKKQAYCQIGHRYQATTPMDHYLKGQSYFISNDFQRARKEFEYCCRADKGNTQWIYYDHFL